MLFTYHALERIKRGDKDGLRTTLTPEEIKEILESDNAIPYCDGLVFYSERDKKCLGAVIRNETVITIVPEDRINYLSRLLAKRMVMGEEVHCHESLPTPSTWQKYDSALFGVSYYTVSNDRYRMRRLVEECTFLNWFDFSVDIFRYVQFLKIVTENIEAILAVRHSASQERVLSVRGYGWRMEEPISLTFRLFGTAFPRT